MPREEARKSVFTSGTTEVINIVIALLRPQFYIAPLMTHLTPLSTTRHRAVADAGGRKRAKIPLRAVKRRRLAIDRRFTMMPFHDLKHQIPAACSRVTRFGNRPIQSDHMIAFAAFARRAGGDRRPRRPRAHESRRADLDCDGLCDSGHKLCGPTDRAFFLMGKHAVDASPFKGCGDMILSGDLLREDTYNTHTAQVFEAGYPPPAIVKPSSSSLGFWLPHSITFPSISYFVCSASSSYLFSSLSLWLQLSP